MDPFRARVHRFHRVLIGFSLLLLSVPAAGPAHAVEESCAVVLDTLGQASTETVFSVFGSGGNGISSGQLTGPAFTLTGTTTITEIGAFVNNCRTIIGGVPMCPDTSPFLVQIYPARPDGDPDPSTVLATFELSHENAPLLASFESVQTALTLGPGTYYALFAAQGSDAGYLLGHASIPFPYTAESTLVGFVHPQLSTGAGVIPAAVRILGDCVTAVAVDVKPGSFPNSVNPRSRGVLPVALLTTATFDATTVDPDTVRLGAAGAAGAAPVHAALEDVDRDGDLDLVLHFRTQETGIDCGTAELFLQGETSGGQAIAGSDSIRTVGCR